MKSIKDFMKKLFNIQLSAIEMFGDGKTRDKY